jgi:UDP-glucose 6-dehydrogenase
MKVAVVGLGYVGTVTAACLAANGHQVCGVDVDAAKAGEICAGRSPVAEPGLGDLVGQAVAAGALRATTSCPDALDGAELSLICVGTPSTTATTASSSATPAASSSHDGCSGSSTPNPTIITKRTPAPTHRRSTSGLTG